MIDTRQYRVGNFIQSDGDMFAIDHINSEFIGAGALTVYVPNADHDEIDIPLTPELLEKAGFRLVDETMGSGIEGIKGPYYAHDALLLWSNGSEPKNAYLVYYGSGEFGKYFAARGRWINVLHDLQNVYFGWSGKELTIKL